MALHTILLISLALPLFILSFEVNVTQAQPSTFSDRDLVDSQLNLEYLVAEFFLYGATGRGLDFVAPELAQGGPPPVGGKLASLDPLIKDFFLQIGLQKVGHLRAIKRTVPGFPRPLLNISKEIFAGFANAVVGQTLIPPFNPYANTINFLLSAYAVSEYPALGYVGISPEIQNGTLKRLVASLLGIEYGQNSVIRAYLYTIRNFRVPPYSFTVAEFTKRLSELGNTLGKEGTKSEGLVVPLSEGAEGKVSGNVIAADKDSLAYAKQPREILRGLYGGGNESIPGAFFPNGASGRIATSF